jgi:succinate dehydrogenase / fumarate reductase, cytochrome b subunit
MPESSEGRLRKLWNSSIGPKIVMGLTGVILVGFVLVHMAGNLQIYIGSETFNNYAQTLQSMKAVVWATRVVLLVSVLLHIAAAYRLTIVNMRARPQAYAAARRYGKTSYAALFMRGSGVVLLAFIVFHILHFTVGAIQHDNWDLHEVLRNGVWVREANPDILAKLPADQVRHDAYSMFVRGFQNPLVAGWYVLSMLLLGSHLRHGVSSMLATLGLSYGSARALAERVGLAVAALVMLGNISFPIAVQAGLVHL